MFPPLFSQALTDSSVLLPLMACFPAVQHKALICPGRAVTPRKNKGFEACVRGVSVSFWRTQLLSAELTRDQNTSFLPALASSSPGLASCCHREHSLLWLPLLLLALTVCREEEKGDSTSVEWRKAVVGKESMFRLQDIDCW